MDYHYLSERPLGGADLVNHPEWDADHGGESEQPADDIAPPRVHILIVVLERSVFNEGEGKGTLETQILLSVTSEQLPSFHFSERGLSCGRPFCDLWKAATLLN